MFSNSVLLSCWSFFIYLSISAATVCEQKKKEAQPTATLFMSSFKRAGETHWFVKQQQFLLTETYETLRGSRSTKRFYLYFSPSAKRTECRRHHLKDSVTGGCWEMKPPARESTDWSGSDRKCVRVSLDISSVHRQATGYRLAGNKHLCTHTHANAHRVNHWGDEYRLFVLVWIKVTMTTMKALQGGHERRGAN